MCSIIQILWLVSFLLTVQGGPPKITSFTGPAFNKIPFQLEDLTLQCTATGRPEPVISFVRNGTTLMQKPGVTTTRNSITIRRVDYKTDSGLYQCLAENKDGGVLSNEINVRVRVLGLFLQPNRLIDPAKFVDVTVGRPVELRCPPRTFTYPANFLWGDIPLSGRPRVLHTTAKRYVLSNGNLFYSYLEDSDITEINNKLGGVSCILYILGKYRPSVKLRLRKQGALTLDFAPRFRERLPRSLSVGIGTSHTFFCAAAGKPLPTILWYFKNVQIRTQTPGIVISPTGHKLTLQSVARASTGLYYCQVQNRLGTIRSDSQLTVEFPPARNPTLTDIKSQPGVDINLNCTSSGTQPIFYQWYRNGDKIFSNYTYRATAGSLLIKSANVSSTGIFQCMARNNYGTLLSKVYVDIKEAYRSRGGDDGFSWEVIVAITCGGVAFILLMTVGAYYMFK